MMDEYQRIAYFLTQVIERDKVKPGMPVEFLIESRRIARHSTPEVREYISTIYEKVAALQLLEATQEQADDSEKFENLKKQDQIRKWLEKQLEEITDSRRDVNSPPRSDSKDARNH